MPTLSPRLAPILLTSPVLSPPADLRHRPFQAEHRHGFESSLLHVSYSPCDRWLPRSAGPNVHLPLVADHRQGPGGVEPPDRCGVRVWPGRWPGKQACFACCAALRFAYAAAVAGGAAPVPCWVVACSLRCCVPSFLLPALVWSRQLDAAGTLSHAMQLPQLPVVPALPAPTMTPHFPVLSLLWRPLPAAPAPQTHRMLFVFTKNPHLSTPLLIKSYPTFEDASQIKGGLAAAGCGACCSCISVRRWKATRAASLLASGPSIDQCVPVCPMQAPRSCGTRARTSPCPPPRPTPARPSRCNRGRASSTGSSRPRRVGFC